MLMYIRKCLHTPYSTNPMLSGTGITPCLQRYGNTVKCLKQQSQTAHKDQDGYTEQVTQNERIRKRRQSCMKLTLDMRRYYVMVASSASRQNGE
jgi:hypothetical protein